MKYKILVVGCDAELSGKLTECLREYGYLVCSCKNFENVIEEFEQENPHLVLLDTTLPYFNGFYWCRKIRALSLCPIVFLSSGCSDSERIRAVMMGGDDYITRPFSLEAIMAKIYAILRRIYGEYASPSTEEIKCVDCVFSKSKLELGCRGNVVEISKTEAGIIRMLFQNYPNIVSRENLLNEIWNNESYVEENTLNVTIFRIRKRLQKIGSSLTIKSVRKAGYRVVCST